MNPNIANLHAIAAKSERQIVGLMSGTSLDGLDLALCRIGGSGRNTRVSVEHFHTIDYSEDLKAQIRSVFSRRSVDLQHLCLMNEKIGLLHGRMVLDSLCDWHVDPTDVDLIASHGQTVYHAPKGLHRLAGFPSGTLQIGDADHLATVTGITTCSDFRQKHLAAGGDGAPLVLYGDYYIFASESENRILLNLGGVANVTYLPAGARPSEVVGTDVGPGNTMMDAFVREHFDGLSFDRDAKIARRGTVSKELLHALRANAFFDAGFPKTTGPELFNLEYLSGALAASRTTDLSLEDQLATLSQFSAESICTAIRRLSHGQGEFHVYASGGGIHNPLLLDNIRRGLADSSVYSTDILGIDPDAKEAVLFAILANECVAGAPSRFGDDSAGMSATTLGKISFPV